MSDFIRPEGLYCVVIDGTTEIARWSHNAPAVPDTYCNDIVQQQEEEDVPRPKWGPRWWRLGVIRTFEEEEVTRVCFGPITLEQLAEQAALELEVSESRRLQAELNQVLHPDGDGPKRPSFCDLVAYVRNDLNRRRSEKGCEEQLVISLTGEMLRLGAEKDWSAIINLYEHLRDFWDHLGIEPIEFSEKGACRPEQHANQICYSLREFCSERYGALSISPNDEKGRFHG